MTFSFVEYHRSMIGRMLPTGGTLMLDPDYSKRASLEVTGHLPMF